MFLRRKLFGMRNFRRFYSQSWFDCLIRKEAEYHLFTAITTFKFYASSQCAKSLHNNRMNSTIARTAPRRFRAAATDEPTRKTAPACSILGLSIFCCTRNATDSTHDES
jgi:hypothetical protein